MASGDGPCPARGWVVQSWRRYCHCGACECRTSPGLHSRGRSKKGKGLDAFPSKGHTHPFPSLGARRGSSSPGRGHSGLAKRSPANRAVRLRAGRRDCLAHLIGALRPRRWCGAGRALCSALDEALFRRPAQLVQGIREQCVRRSAGRGPRRPPRSHESRLRRLGQTRLPFRIALGTSDPYGDGRSADGYGLDVDVVLPTEASATPGAILRLAGYFGGG
jgi:hypothetical protein